MLILPFAGRTVLAIIEVAVSLFDGTSREPLLIANPAQTVPEGFQAELVPFYQQITQLGFELQGNIEDTLWKLEMIHNQNNIEDYWALQGGFEYSMYGIYGIECGH